MNKGELIDKVAADAGITKASAKVAVDSVFDSITASMKKGDRVTIVGFGTFESAKRSRRKGINPATGESIWIKAQFVPKFKAGKGLKDEVAKRRK